MQIWSLSPQTKAGRAAAATLLALALCLVALWALTPSYDSVRAKAVASDKYFYDRNGELLHVLRTDHVRRQYGWVDSEAVSPVFAELLLRAEDRRFWYHPGIDPIGIARAAFRAKQWKSQGASTITMQVARNFVPLYHALRRRLPVVAKLLQSIQALGLELRWSKAEILSAYVNMVAFRSEVVGLPAAASLTFGKGPSALNVNESAVLVAMIRSPNSDLQKLTARACVLLGPTSGDDCTASLGKLIVQALNREFATPTLPMHAPHLAAMFARSGLTSGSKVQTTINASLQRFVHQSVRGHLLELGGQNANDAAVLVVDNRSHEVLAYVGGSGSLSSASHVDGVKALRQAGSTLKPFIYGKALEKRIITAATVLDDSPADLAVSTGGVYSPRNFDEKFRGPVSVRDALAGSLNIPAIRTLDLIGLDEGIATLMGFGFSKLREVDFYGPSLVLGAADVSLLELVSAYHHLANGGTATPIKVEPGPADPGLSPAALSPEASFIVTSILSDNLARARSFGLNSSLATAENAAVKTGTSKDMRDNWCIGYTKHYTVGVWVGNFSGASMWNLTGVAGAAPIWADIIHFLHQDEAAPPFELAVKDLNLVKKRVSFSFKPGKTPEWFITGTEPEGPVRTVDPQVHTKILYPTHQSILAVDNDIPSANQRAVFEASGSTHRFVWELNGELLASNVQTVEWPVQRGHFVLALKSADTGAELDKVSFIVR